MFPVYSFVLGYTWYALSTPLQEPFGEHVALEGLEEPQVELTERGKLESLG